MLITVKSTITLLASIAAFLYLNLGMDYVNFGSAQGVHPMAAIPVALAMFVTACFTQQIIDTLHLLLE